MTEYDVAQLARLEPAYQERLGLNTAPFPPTHEDRFLFLDPERRQRLQMLQHLTQYSNLLLLLIGERGIGKTSLLDRFAAEARPEWALCRIQAHPLMDADRLLLAIAEGFGLPAPPHDPAALQEALFQHLLKLREQDRTPILIIDDAHELPRDALLAVFHLADAEAAEGNLLRCILACEPQIETMLEDPAIAALRERITHSIDVPPLARDTLGDYLAHRLAVAGHQGPSPFTDKALDQIWRTAQGNPARINEAAHLWLSDGDTELPPPLDEAEAEDDTPSAWRYRSRGQVVAAAGVALVLITILIFQDRINALFEASPPPRTETPGTPEPATPETARATPSAPSSTPKPAPAPATEVPSPAPVKPLPETASTPAAESASPAEPPGDVPPPPPAPRLLRIEPDTLTGSREPVTLTLHGEGFTADSRIELIRTQARRFLPPERITWIDTRTARITFVPGTDADTVQVRVHGPGDRVSDAGTIRINAAPRPRTTPAPSAGTGAPAKSAKPRPPAPANLWDTDWINRQPATHYTLQLLATRQRDSVQRFVRQHGLDGLAVAFASQRNGQTWYTVIVGSFPDRQSAQRAFRQLPASVQRRKPWIRRFDGIQAALAAKPATPASPLPLHSPPPANLDRHDHLSWLWNRDPSHYALQLLAGRNEAGIRRFLRQHQLLGKAVYYRTRRGEQTVYVIVQGDYPSRQDARKAITELPAALQKLHPWPRRFADIHAELEAN